MRRTQTNPSTTRLLPLSRLFLVFLLASAPAHALTDASISPSVAGLFIGETKVVEGAVTAAERESNVVRLHLGKPPQELLVSLVIGLLNDFPPAPETYYAGKTVRVAGTLRSFRGVPEIVVHDPADIRIMGNNAPSGGLPAASAALPAAAVAMPPADVPPARLAVSAQPARDTDQPSVATTVDARIDALLERVRQLEDRVRQLENSRSSQ